MGGAGISIFFMEVFISLDQNLILQWRCFVRSNFLLGHLSWSNSNFFKKCKVWSLEGRFFGGRPPLADCRVVSDGTIFKVRVLAIDGVAVEHYRGPVNIN